MRRCSPVLLLVACSIAFAQETPRVDRLEGGQFEINDSRFVLFMDAGADVTINEGAEIRVAELYDGSLLLEGGSVSSLQSYNASDITILDGEFRSVRFLENSSAVIRGGTFFSLTMEDQATLDFYGGDIAATVSAHGDEPTLNIRGGAIPNLVMGSRNGPGIATLNLLNGDVTSAVIDDARVNITGGSVGTLHVTSESDVYFYGDDLQSETNWAWEDGSVRNVTVTGSLADGTEINVDATILNSEVNFLPGACAATLFGDFTGDGVTDFRDFLIVADNFGSESSDPLNGDADCDGRVGFTDFLVVSANYQENMMQVRAVPEPSGRILMLGGFVILTLNFRR